MWQKGTLSIQHPLLPSVFCCRPPELEALVCGGRVLDMEALQGATHYDDGYTATHQVVQWFWEVSPQHVPGCTPGCD